MRGRTLGSLRSSPGTFGRMTGAAVACPGPRDTPVVLLAAADLDAHKGKANAALAWFVALHPSNLALKSEIIVEHFRRKHSDPP